jgi:hypothetical protein
MKKRSHAVVILLLCCLLGSYNGYIALWNQGERQPVKVFPYQVASLPPADQAALKRGIIIEEKSELQEILQDYLS